MASEKFERRKPHINVSTIGHVDHGKTTLTAAITAVCSKMGYSKSVAFDSIDNAPEEKARGITIKASTVPAETAKNHYSVTDCPGHYDYIKNLIAGASQSDIVILLISAKEGTMAQTNEHILLANQINVKNLIVFINKIDELDDPTLLELCEEEARELAAANGFPNAKILSGSALGALQGEPKYEEGIKNLLKVLDETPIPPRETSKPFLMPVEAVHVKQGRGTIVTGKIEQGTIKIGDKVDIVGQNKEILTTTVTGVETFKQELDEGQAGDNVGLLLRGIAKKDLKRGNLIAAPNSIKPYKKFKSEVYFLTEKEGGRTQKQIMKVKFSPQFFIRTANVTGTIEGIYSRNDDGTLQKKEMIIPGDQHITLEIALIHQIGIEKGLKFAIREGKKTIGAGIVTEVIA